MDLKRFSGGTVIIRKMVEPTSIITVWMTMFHPRTNPNAVAIKKPIAQKTPTKSTIN
jgi:hypothetical protein